MLSQEQMDEYERAIREAQLSAQSEKLRNVQQEVMMQGQEKSMITEQLNLGEELERIDYLLRGFTLLYDEQTGGSKWVKPDNNELIVLSDYGVHLIRNTIAWYLNKNTLLSNYDESTINDKMEDFASDLNDTIFMEYEKIFQYPTMQECEAELQRRLKDKLDVKLFTYKLIGKNLTEQEKKEIEKDILNEIEPRVEREMIKIKEQIIKNKLKRFLLIMRLVQDAVHSTYLRAWKGMERGTLRQHTTISETRGTMMMPKNNDSSFFGRFRK